jgi:hypothetical protein
MMDNADEPKRYSLVKERPPPAAVPAAWLSGRGEREQSAAEGLGSTDAMRNHLLDLLVVVNGQCSLKEACYDLYLIGPTGFSALQHLLRRVRKLIGVQSESFGLEGVNCGGSIEMPRQPVPQFLCT